MQAVLINSTLATMVAAFGTYTGFAVSRRRLVGQAGTLLFSAAYLLLTAFLMDRWLLLGRAPWSNMYESLTMVVWAACGLYIVLEQVYRTRALGFIMALLILLGLMVASTFDQTPGKLMPALQSYWITIHVSIILSSYAAFTVAFAASVYYLAARHRRLRIAGDLPETRKVALAEIAVYQAFSTTAMRFGFFALIIGIFLGGVWAQEAWGRFWGWDPKETWALITWLVYLFGLHVKYVPGRLGIKDMNAFFAWLAIVGFVVTMFTYFAVNLWISGLHSYA